MVLWVCFQHPHLNQASPVAEVCWEYLWNPHHQIKLQKCEQNWRQRTFLPKIFPICPIGFTKCILIKLAIFIYTGRSTVFNIQLLIYTQFNTYKPWKRPKFKTGVISRRQTPLVCLPWSRCYAGSANIFALGIGLDIHHLWWRCRRVAVMLVMTTLL